MPSSRASHPRRPASRLVGRAALGAARRAAGPREPGAARLVAAGGARRGQGVGAASARRAGRARAGGAAGDRAGQRTRAAREPRPRWSSAALRRLRTLALVWGSPDRPVLVVRELLATARRSAGRRGGGAARQDRRSGAGDPRPPRRHRCRRPLERGRRAHGGPGVAPVARAHRRAARAAALVGTPGAGLRRPAAASTSHRRWPRPSAARRWSTGPLPAPRSSWYDGPSCSWTDGAPIPRRA